ncbi:MAG: hypothetical protein VB071_14440 [Lawsonibacter sp.]|nr:hypothetical protein [Lawsonibacter sp.]
MKTVEMNNHPKTLDRWNEILNPSEAEALEDYGYTDPCKVLTPNEVFEIIVEWNGGIATAYHIKSIISRVYGLKF